MLACLGLVLAVAVLTTSYPSDSQVSERDASRRGGHGRATVPPAAWAVERLPPVEAAIHLESSAVPRGRAVRLAGLDAPPQDRGATETGLPAPEAPIAAAAPMAGAYREAAPERDERAPLPPPPQLPSPLPPRSGDTFRIPLRGALPPEAVQVDARTGLVSIVVRGAPLNEILGALAEQLGVNIISAEDISARVSVTLRRTPFEQALTHILSAAGYTWVRQDDVLIVTSVTAGGKVSPYAQGREVRVFPLDYVSATDIDLVIKGLLSPVGKSFVTQSTEKDNRKTQELAVVEDLPAYLDRVDQYVRQVDLPPRQVLIEVHVLSVELKDDLKHGINLKYLDSIGVPALTLKTQGMADALSFGTGVGPAFFFNIAASDLGVLLEALETTNDAKTLATPKVLALNGQEARIQVGQRLGYRITTTTQTSSVNSVEFLDVGVVLKVTPRITKEGCVIMQVKPEVSKGEIDSKTELPKEDTTEVETAVMLPDGRGMLIGGLIQESDVESQLKVPIIGDVWLIGRLFQKREVKRLRTEIIVALVPHVVPYGPERDQRECEQFRRATTPLLYGPLLQHPRPEEPRLPDAGQNLPWRYKLEHLCPLPDSGCWSPRGSTETCGACAGALGPAPCDAGFPYRQAPGPIEPPDGPQPALAPVGRP